MRFSAEDLHFLHRASAQHGVAADDWSSSKDDDAGDQFQCHGEHEGLILGSLVGCSTWKRFTSRSLHQ